MFVAGKSHARQANLNYRDQATGRVALTYVPPTADEQRACCDIVPLIANSSGTVVAHGALRPASMGGR